jgi:hypothetical protein
MNGVIEPLERVDGAAPAVPSPMHARQNWEMRWEMRAADIQQWIAAGFSEATAKQIGDRPEVWENNEYRVSVGKPTAGSGFLTGCVLQQLSIERRDGAAVQDWRDLQAIKNELCGSEYEAIELYPAESRVVDTLNVFHLFVLLSHKDRASPRFPLGWATGDRQTDPEPGNHQRERPGLPVSAK